jgi:CMP/dCMP kinase
MKITLSGTAGSGKSSVAKKIAEKLGYKHFSMGDFQRELALEHGLTILEWGKLEATDKKYDLMVDEKQKQIGTDNDEFVMDSWLAALFIPDSVKIFLTADIDECVRRRLGHKRKEENFDDIKIAKENMLERKKVNRDRWIEFYDFDITDLNNYDLVIDTTNITIEEVVDKVLEYINNKK